jgi:oxygen-independent coproporphyrinogen-3 oxidase
MVIVKNARVIVKVNYYCLADDDDPIATAIGQVMELFGIQPNNPLFSCLEGLPVHTVLVNNRISQTKEQLSVTTDIYLKLTNGTTEVFSFKQIADLDNDEPSLIKRLVKLNVLTAMRQLSSPHAAPWGILRGIRPSKIVHRLIDKGLDKAATSQKLIMDYGIDIKKSELITDIAFRQRKFLLSPERAKHAVSVYVGIPYCPSKCLYCSFPSYVLPDSMQVERFLQGLNKEIRAIAALIKQYNLEVQTVYVGGGTPTSLGPTQFSDMLSQVHQALVTPATREFTVEAGRPDSVDEHKIATMQRLGVTRVSVNPQTMQEKTLKHIGRKHTTRDIINLFQKIRHAGIPVVNMDIIVGLPGEDEKSITDTMKQIYELRPDNLTIHTLALKKGSSLKANLIEYVLPNERLTQQMLDIATDFAVKMQMEPYYLYRQKYMNGNLENIGYSMPGKECLYNIQVMEERQTIFGIGPAATTKIVKPCNWTLENIFNAKDILTYINKVDHTLQVRCQLLAEAFA